MRSNNEQNSIDPSAVEPLSPRHDRSTFTCGNATLDNWIQRTSSKATKNDTARTYVVCQGDVVVGYYAVCAASIEPQDALPASSARHDVPAILLAKLAVHTSWQRRGVGEILLLDALRVSAVVADSVAAALLVVDAIDDAAATYYEARGFMRFDSDPRRLYLPMKSIRTTLEAAGSD